MTTLTQSLHTNNTPIADGLSDQYAPISTDILLAPFYNNGWTKKKHIKPVKNRAGDRIGKEQLTLIHPDFIYANGDQLTVECLNSNNGTGALMLMGGYGRIVCSNGLIIGDIEGGRFVHRGTTIYERIQDQYETIVAKLDDMRETVTLLQSVTLDRKQIEQVILNLTTDVFGRDTKQYKSTVEVDNRFHTRLVDRLTNIKRTEDASLDAFTVLNVVQENIIRRGNLYNVLVETTNKETKEVVREYKGKAVSEGNICAIKMNKSITNAFLSVVKEVA